MKQQVKLFLILIYFTDAVAKQENKTRNSCLIVYKKGKENKKTTTLFEGLEDHKTCAEKY